MKTVITFMCDMHSGSPFALFPDKQMQFKSCNHSPTPLQKIIYRQFMEACEHIQDAKRGARHVVINLGDAIEGMHHDSKEYITPYLFEQKMIHTELMNEFGKRAGWDKLYYIDGTPAHAGEAEFDIARKLGAEPCGESSTWPELRGMIDGSNTLLWAAHHGTAAGKELSRGNSLRNKLREIYYESQAEGKAHPDLVVYADRHEHRHEQFERGKSMIHGFLAPAWKVKDGYTYKVAAFSDPNVGALVVTIDDEIKHKFLTLEVEQDRTVTI